MLPEITYERSLDLLGELNASNLEIRDPPKNVDEYVRYEMAVKAIEDKMQNYSNRFTEIKGTMELMDNREIKYPERNKQKYMETLQSLTQLRKRIAYSYEHAESDKIRFTRELRDKINGVEKRVVDLKEHLSDPRIANKDSKTGDMKIFFDSIGDTVYELVQDTNNFN